MQSLHEAGHRITMITPFPSDANIENFTYIDSRLDTFAYADQSIEEWRDMTLYIWMDTVLPRAMKYCMDVMKLKQIQVSRWHGFRNELTHFIFNLEILRRKRSTQRKDCMTSCLLK